MIEPLTKTIFLEHDLIEPNPFQPRKTFRPDDIYEKKTSLLQWGLLQPLVVRPPQARGGKHQLIAGEMRWRAIGEINDDHKLPHFGPIKCELREVDDLTSLEMALIENAQRHSLNALEYAWAYAALERMGMPQDRIGARFNLHPSTISNTLRLLDLPEPVKPFITGERLSRAHAVTLCSLNDDPPNCLSFAEKAAEGDWTQKALESEIAAFRLEKANAQQPGIFDEPVPAAQMTGEPLAREPAAATIGPAEEPDDTEPEIGPFTVDVTYDEVVAAAKFCDPARQLKDQSTAFTRDDKQYVCVHFKKDRERYLSAECWHVVHLHQFEGQTVRYGEMLGEWDSKARTKGHRHGWKISDGDLQYVAVGGPYLFTAPTEEKKAEPAEPTSKDEFKLKDGVQWEAKKKQWATGKIAEVGRTIYFVQPTGTTDARKRKEFKKADGVLKAWDGKSVPGPSPKTVAPAPAPSEYREAVRMITTYVPAEALRICHDKGYDTEVVFACMVRMIALAEDRSITAQEYLDELESCSK